MNARRGLLLLLLLYAAGCEEAGPAGDDAPGPDGPRAPGADNDPDRPRRDAGGGRPGPAHPGADRDGGALPPAPGDDDPLTPGGDDPPPPGDDEPRPPAGDDGADPCDEELAWFTRELYRPILAVQCIGCHTEDGVARATRLRLEPEGTPGWDVDSYAATRSVALAEVEGESLLLLKPSLRHPDGHTGGRLIPEGSPEYAVLEAFVERVHDSACAPGDPLPPGDDDPAPPGGDDPLPPGDDDPLPSGGDDPLPPGGDDPAPPGDDDPQPPGDDDPQPPGGDDPAPPGGDDPRPPVGGDPRPPAGDDGAAPCDEELAWFTQELYRPILAVRCIGCHTEDGVARDTRLRLVPEGAPGWEVDSYAATRSVALAELAGESLLLLKPSLRHPDGHTGGRLIPEGSPEYAVFEAFVERVHDPACAPEEPVEAACEDIRPGRPLLRRLTPDEYDRTIRDLFGFESEYGQGFATDPVIDGFANRAEALTVSPLLADQLRVAAEAIAARAAADPGALAGCAARPDAGEPCLREVLAGFGTRVFRRPLTPDEIDRYAALYRLGAEDDGFAAGFELVLSALLQSPHFLYRSEVGTADGDGRLRLSPHETATALAYMITGSTPDDELLAAAAAGELATPDGREAQARRLLATAAHRERVRQFVLAWLDLERLAVVPKDAATFPELTAEVRAAMRREVEALVDHAVFEGSGRLPELLTADYTFIDEVLARFYGLDGRGRVEPPDGERAGLLTLGATMVVHSRPNDTSPVHRGRLVRERLLCQPLPPPPPGAVAELPPVDPDQTVRERYAAHSEVQPCVSCHRLMDPIGFAFEGFDGVGRWRDGVDDTLGVIVGSEMTDGEVDGTRALGAHLAASREVHDCFARQAFRFAYGIAADAETTCLLDEVQRSFREGDLAFEALFVALARSEHLAWRVGELSDEPPPPPDDDVPDPDAGLPPPDMEPEPMPPDVVFEDVVETSWETGACHRVTVRNEGDMSVEWVVALDVDGTLSQHWNCEPDADTGRIRFRGVHWNAELSPGAETDFGFCVAH